MKRARSAKRRYFRRPVFSVVVHSTITLDELRGAIAYARENAIQPDANGDLLLQRGTVGELLGFRIVESAHG